VVTSDDILAFTELTISFASLYCTRAASLSLIVGTSTVPLVDLRSSGSSALCRARFPMMDRELCRAMGCRMREDDGSHCFLEDLASKCSLCRFWLARAHFRKFSWQRLTFTSLAGKGSFSSFSWQRLTFLAQKSLTFL